MSSDPGISSSDLRIALAVVLGVLGGLAAVWYAFRWDRKRREGSKTADDVELGSSSSRPQQREDMPTNRYDDSRNDTTLPAYNRRDADEIPSLFRLSLSITSLKVSEQEPTTSPFHLILFERISKLHTMIKEVQSMLEAAPAEGYESQSKEGRALADLKKEMLELVGTPEWVNDIHSPSESDASQQDIPPISVASTPELYHSPNDDASRHQQLITLHSLLTLLSPIASKSTAGHDSIFEGLDASIEALLHSLDTVPIPSSIRLTAGERETTSHRERDSGSQPNPPPFSPHLQSLPGQGDQLPPYESS